MKEPYSQDIIRKQSQFNPVHQFIQQVVTRPYASGVIVVAAVMSQRKSKQSVDCGCEDMNRGNIYPSGETEASKYQDQYQIRLLCAPRFQRKTEEEERGFVWGEKVLELTLRNRCLTT